MFKRLPILMNEREDDEPEESAGFDWAEIGSETASAPEQNAATEDTSTPSGTPPSSPTAAPPVAAPSEPAPAPAAAAPQPAVQAPAPVPVAPAQTTTPVAEPAAPPPQALTPTPSPTAEQIAEWRGKMLEQLKAQYALKPDQVNAMLTEPETVLPALLAEVHLRAMEQLAPTILQRVPQVVEQVSRAQQSANKVGQQFVDRWPELKPVLEADPNKLGAIGQMAQTYRQLNPNATTEDLINKVGAMALVHFKVQPQATQPAPAAPAAPQAAPFVPAGQSAARGAPAAPNIFEALAMSSDTDDDY